MRFVAHDILRATLFQIQIFAFTQAIVPAELIGKVFSCLMALSLCAQPIGQVLFGELFERLETMPWAVVLGAAVMSCVIAVYSRKCFGEIE